MNEMIVNVGINIEQLVPKLEDEFSDSSFTYSMSAQFCFCAAAASCIMHNALEMTNLCNGHLYYVVNK